MDEIMEKMMAKIESLEARLPPVVAPVKTRKVSCCSKCGKEGHYKTWCPTNDTVPAPAPAPAPAPKPPMSVASDESCETFSHTSSRNIYVPLNHSGRPIETDERCVEWFDKLMTKLGLDYHESNDFPMWIMLKTLYKHNKDSFHIIGGLHNDNDGRTYYSVKVALENNHYGKIHVYGNTRFDKFIVNCLTLIIANKKYEFKFTYTKKQNVNPN